MVLAAKDGSVPLTIITGFLGSGKTTLINHMLADIQGKEKLAIVKNEIGDVSVDSEIIRGKNIIMKELLNGCVCCTLIGELEESLKELVETVKPDRIIIETSGAANPAILAVNIDRIPFLKRDLIVTVIDVVHFPGYKDKTTVARLQHQFTDLVVLNRVGEVDESVIDSVLDDVYEQRPGIPVVRTETGRVPLDVLFGSTEKCLSHEDLVQGGLESGHLERDGIEYFSYVFEGSVTKNVIENVLGGLSDEYFRVKGFAVVEGATVPVLVNWVCGRLELVEVPEMLDRKTRLVFIGKGIGKYRDSVCTRLRGNALT
jgi:G3E family GTPase